MAFEIIERLPAIQATIKSFAGSGPETADQLKVF
jgi:hypothetical protein